MKDYYKILELDPAATIEQIRNQHKLLLHAWHPDKFPDGDLKYKAHEKIIEINEAFNILGNATKRNTYDQEYRINFRHSSPNNGSQSSNEKVNTDQENRTNPNASSTPKENVSTSPKNKTAQDNKLGKKSRVFIPFVFGVIGLCFLFSALFVQGQNQVINRQNVSIPTNTITPARTITPSFTLDPLASLRSKCIYWADVDSSLLGQTICVYGEIVTFTPKEEVRVPAIGSEWIWYYYFSNENKDFFVNHASVDKEFPDGYIGCIVVTGSLKSSKSNVLYLEIWSENWELINDC